MIQNKPAIYRLKARWTALALTSAALLSMMWATVQKMFGSGVALLWLPAALIITAIVLGLLRWQLDLNRKSDGYLLSSIGLANLITVLRGLLIAAVAGFVVIQPSLFSDSKALMWLLGSLFVTALLLDIVDGRVARRYDRITELGRRLDTQIDGLTVLCGCLLAVKWGKAPLWFITTGLAYYLFCCGCWLRKRLSMPCNTLPPSKFRRLLAGLMMTVIAIILFPPVFPALGKFTATIVAVPFLAHFLWDWLTVCRFKPSLSKNF